MAGAFGKLCDACACDVDGVPRLMAATAAGDNIKEQNSAYPHERLITGRFSVVYRVGIVEVSLDINHLHLTMH